MSNSGATNSDASDRSHHAVASGLEGIVVAQTELSDVDGLHGKLCIRGYDVEEIATKAIFEEVAFLLWHGRLPKKAELEELHSNLATARILPEETIAALNFAAKRMHPMDALRFAVASLTADDPNIEDDSRENNLHRAITLTARMPVIVATYHRLRSGLSVPEPKDDWGIAANFLYQLKGNEPDPAEVRALNTYLVTVADHGMNASTFTARVIASTQSDMVSAITGAIGALKGPLHGGAPEGALEMIEAIGTPDRAESWMREAISQGKRLMGFGHRIYKVRDPRAEVLYRAAEALADETGEKEALALAREVERVGVRILAEYKPGRNLNTNVEFYTALLLRELGLTKDLFTPTFAIGRTAGWTAHILEQKSSGRLIRPESEYVGPRDLRYVPLEMR